jgi:hypothetical protein
METAVQQLSPGPNRLMRVLLALSQGTDEEATKLFYSLHIVEHRHYTAAFDGICPAAPDPKVRRATRPDFNLGERKSKCNVPGCQIRGWVVNYYQPPMVLPPDGNWRSGFQTPTLQAAIVYEDAECTMYM